MALFIILLILAVLLGFGGLLIKGLFWLLVIGAVVLVVDIIVSLARGTFRRS